jgi:hypothetical protein
LFQLLLVELSIDLPSLVNRHVHRGNGKFPFFTLFDYLHIEGGLHFKDQAHGIKTDLFAIERYVEEVKAEIMSKLPPFNSNLNSNFSEPQRIYGQPQQASNQRAYADA